MKLFLDAHVSGRRIGRVLRERGHDVRAADEERSLDGLGDEALFQLAADEGRVMITFNVKDFAPLVRDWGGAGRNHAGCILVTGLRHGDIGLLLKGVDRLLEQRPSQSAWVDYCCFLTPGKLEPG